MVSVAIEFGISQVCIKHCKIMIPRILGLVLLTILVMAKDNKALTERQGKGERLVS